MDESQVVLCSVDTGIATITLNRPERNNGWTNEMEVAYYAALGRCEADPAVRAIVVTGAGRSFCPGADMAGLQAFAAGTRATGGGSSAGSASHGKAVTYPLSIRKPIIGALNGATAGVGLVQALMFDVRFASRTAKFTCAFSRRGLIAEYGSAWLLPRIVGESVARDLMLSGRVFAAPEAKELGLVNFVSEPDAVLAEATAYARDVADNCAPWALAVMKDQFASHPDLTLDAATSEAVRLMHLSLGRADIKEGVASFVEKRLPSFQPFDPDETRG